MNCTASYQKTPGGYTPLMCLMDRPSQWKEPTASDQKGLSDLIEIVITPMTYDMLATEGASCGTFVHLAGAKGNAEMLDIAFQLMRKRNIKLEDIAHITNVPANNAKRKNPMGIAWHNKLQQLKNMSGLESTNNTTIQTHKQQNNKQNKQRKNKQTALGLA